MSAQATVAAMMEQDERIEDVVAREGGRLRSFIRRRVADAADVEDVLQDVLFELVRANRMLVPIEFVTGWLFRVARNRITDLFRRRKAVSLSESAAGDDEGAATLEDLLPSLDAGPDAVYARGVLMDAVEEALEELPESQREVFVAHELMGRSFQEIAEETGVGVNTLLSRKRYAVLHLRERLRKMAESLGVK